MNDNTPNFELPQPLTPEQQAANPNIDELVIGVPSPESKTQSSGGPGPQQPDPAAAAADAAQVGIVPVADPSAATPTGLAVPPPPTAQDADVIEKEWVDRAKKVVEQTRHDPHEQNKQLNIYKADYVQKRFKKDIKVANN
jgi:hypothetical protein